MPRADVVVVDTDAWRYLYSGPRRTHDSLPTWQQLLQGRTVVIATQTRAEILTGLRQNPLGPEREGRIRRGLERTTPVPVDDAVLQAYVALTVRTRQLGLGIGGPSHVADRWVAATAIAVDAPLLAVDGIYRTAPGLTLLWQESDG